MFYISVHVDHIILAKKSNKKIKAVNKMLASKFEVEDMGLLHNFGWVKIAQDEANGSVWMASLFMLLPFWIDSEWRISKYGSISEIYFKAGPLQSLRDVPQRL